MAYFDPSFHPLGDYHLEQASSPYNNERQSFAMPPQSGAMITMPNPPKTNETKPRLGKDEVDVLEREFQKNPKPTTQTKRQFAEDMAVDLARINNWFQNRRAKRKQERNQEAYEAGQAQDPLPYSEPSSPDTFTNNNNSYIGNGHMLSGPAARFAMGGPPPAISSYDPQYPDPSTESMRSFHRTMAAAQAVHAAHAQAAAEHEDYKFTDQNSSLSVIGSAMQDNLVSFDQSASYQYPARFVTDIYDAAQPITDCQSSTERSLYETSAPYASYPMGSGPDVTVLQPITTTFPSQLLITHTHDSTPILSVDSGCSNQSPEAMDPSYGMGLDLHSMISPQVSSMPFRSPPPMDIASRRKKVQHKPAALSAATMSSRPPVGPRTVSHAENFRRGDSPCSSPMRRVISAGGSSRPVLSGRVQKSGIEAAQRSPINLGGFESAATFLEHNFHSLRNPPSLTGSSSLSSSLAPPTPMSPRERYMTLVKREMTTPSQSTCSPDDSPQESNLSFVFNTCVPGCFTSLEGDLASPPETPQARGAPQLTFNTWADGNQYHEKQWQFEVADEPLYTPGLQDSFVMEMPMPRPTYLSSTVSQPVTPGFGPTFDAGFMFGHESLASETEHESHQEFHVGQETPYFTYPGGVEYSFPESNPFPMGMSPTLAKQKTFQFSHTTAADFSEK